MFTVLPRQTQNFTIITTPYVPSAPNSSL